MKIRNFDALATTPLRRDALTIAEAGLEAIDTKMVMKQGVRLEGDTLFVRDERFDLAGKKRVMVAAVGKCAADAAAALEEILGDRLSGGVAIAIEPSPGLAKIEYFRGTHPMPSETNVHATAALVRMLKGCTADDFVLFVISGGGSTLLSMPEDVGFEVEAQIVKALFNAGATIEELNVIRKHLSLARGGYLAEYAHPAASVALIFSDVIGNDMQFVSSGPTLKDETTIEDAEKILAKYDVLKVCGLHGCWFVKTPKQDEFFANVKNILFVSNETALTAMHAKAAELGYVAKICDSCLTGEARDVGETIARGIAAAPAKSALIYGGETTVTVRVPGKGGRSQELGLSALRFLDDGTIVLPFASDGRDNTDIAGVLCDPASLARAKELKLSPEDFLDRNASYDFFAEVDGQVMTGDTGSNVSDLVIALKS